MNTTALSPIPSLVSRADIDAAISVIRSCEIPAGSDGCPKAAYAPGGSYGPHWWSLDYALTMEGLKWVDFQATLDFIVNLEAVQKPDGRIPLYGPDNYGAFRNIQAPVGSLPKFFESAYDIACMSGDAEIRRRVFSLFDRNLEWWFRERQDQETGLISAVFEETFVPNTETWSHAYAPMDTNVEVLLGCRHASALADELGLHDRARFHETRAADLAAAIQRFLWSEEHGCYLPYLLKERTHDPRRMASMFLGFYLPDESRHARLLNLLKDPAAFNWGVRPITSVAMDDPCFRTVHGRYNGNPAWCGSVWALTNDAVIKALRHAGYHDDARALAVATLRAFRGNYAEFLDPFTGSGEGVRQYAWTAGIFLRIVAEEMR